jgi:hypothetical protein
MRCNVTNSIANENAKRLMTKWKALETELDTILANNSSKEVMKAIMEQSRNCSLVQSTLELAEKGKIQVDVEMGYQFRQENVNMGIKLCCELRKLGYDAVVDMLWGYVCPRQSVNTEEMIDGKKRYMTFEWAEEE